ncbi:hypothetical protein COCCADRAFT_93663 [Bipolaris zeicola 26-R-13]|uniref:Uncharacterized protein n=1 Tax=Cochliobolus carbonum (strain 26-R-13) TaxID=930089 RepID=W6YSD0_COCC2|nr:uncharacterized protein COCCADRAFT_93663 [Bipolaris zeicola 26-R-13]EUC34416.1 hypothetical protein COCCADRAFT_93663 [Bipolaris zeicola 26-R-13]
MDRVGRFPVPRYAAIKVKGKGGGPTTHPRATDQRFLGRSVHLKYQDWQFYFVQAHLGLAYRNRETLLSTAAPLTMEMRAHPLHCQHMGFATYLLGSLA